MGLEDIFRKDQQHWSQEQRQQVDLFFTLSPFFREHYRPPLLQSFCDMTFYHRLDQGQRLSLTDHRQAQVIILLKGQLQVLVKDQRKMRRKKDSPGMSLGGLSTNERWVSAWRTSRAGQLYCPQSECLVVSSAEDSCTQLLYVPCHLYRQLLAKERSAQVQNQLKIIQKCFGQQLLSEEEQLQLVADKQTSIKQYRINQTVYQQGDPSYFCYIVVEGQAKVTNDKQVVVVGPTTLFGQEDPPNSARTGQAVCHSSHCIILLIPLTHYLRLAHQHPKHPLFASVLALHESKAHDKAQSQGKEGHQFLQRRRMSLPPIATTRNRNKQEKEQQRIAGNSHSWVQLSPRRQKCSFRLPKPQQRDYSVDQFEHKMKLYQRHRPESMLLDITHKLF